MSVCIKEDIIFLSWKKTKKPFRNLCHKSAVSPHHQTPLTVMHTLLLEKKHSGTFRPNQKGSWSIIYLIFNMFCTFSHSVSQTLGSCSVIQFRCVMFFKSNKKKRGLKTFHWFTSLKSKVCLCAGALVSKYFSRRWSESFMHLLTPSCAGVEPTPPPPLCVYVCECLCSTASLDCNYNTSAIS